MSTLLFDFYGTRGQCADITARIHRQCAAVGCTPQITQTARGLIRQHYHVTVRGPHDQLQLIGAWWQRMLAAFARMGA